MQNVHYEALIPHIIKKVGSNKKLNIENLILLLKNRLTISYKTNSFIYIYCFFVLIEDFFMYFSFNIIKLLILNEYN